MIIFGILRPVLLLCVCMCMNLSKCECGLCFDPVITFALVLALSASPDV